MEGQERQQAEVQPEPELLYHYTDQMGLLGILKDKCIWATHSHYLNDYSEYKILFEAARVAIYEHLASKKDEAWADTICALLGCFERKGIYVSSFSEDSKGDSLTMWRGYSSDSGRYSIGFDPSELKSIANSFFRPEGEDEGSAFVCKCDYVDPERDDLLNTIKEINQAGMCDIDLHFEDSTGCSSSDIETKLRQTNSDIFAYLSILAEIAVPIKHIGFKEENEWRIALIFDGIVPSKKVEFRQGRSQLVPYVKIDWKKLPDVSKIIRRIVIGPTPNMNEAAKAVEMLLEKENVPIKSTDCPNGVEVVPSKIPYRNW